MARTVTAGLDGSRESVAAAQWAAHEALRRGLPLRLVHVWEWEPTTRTPLVGPETQRHWAERIPREAAEELRVRYPELEITTEQLAGQPAAVLPVAAEEAELLVLGSRGLSGVAGFLVGSVAQAVVATAGRPVILVRAGEMEEDEHRPDVDGLPSATTPYRDVVLGLDTDRPSDELIEFAFDAATRRAAVLRVIHGWSLPPVYGYGYEPGAMDPRLSQDLATDEASALTETLRAWREKFPGVEVTEHAVIGQAARHLIEAASDASLVVVGRRAHRSPIGTHIGPVTHAVLHHSPAPVAVVPHG
jgi:nucleotide-binding universal stress UspA family protein